jgi:ATPase subunit of ABC transporter with duplicated ATPase domains
MLHVSINEKTMGAKTLLKGFELRLHTGEKVGFLGRNGTGKTTLMNLLTARDTDYDGVITIPKNSVVMATSQEHTHGAKDTKTTLDHISSKLPKFSELHTIITTYPDHMGDNMKKLHIYSDALQEFSDLGYYEIENSLEKLFDAYQLDKSLLTHDFYSLSGGQKRLVELIAIQLAQPHIALLDEPTNHMDYIGKEAFIEWLKNTPSSVLVISHDRDVLKNVDRIVELRDQKSHSYPGNYDAYLNQNASRTSNAINEFQTSEKRIANIKEQIEYARARAPGYKGKAGKNPWVVMREKLEKELAGILENHEKPSFWIDQESAEGLAPKMADSYQKFKAKNIRISNSSKDIGSSTVLRLDDVSLGYDNTPLFSGCTFTLGGNDRLHVVGRNGAGKTTLVRAILEAAAHKLPTTLIGRGTIECPPQLRLSLYEQEIGNELLDMTLFEAIEHIYRTKNVPVNEQIVLKDMGNYLFNPQIDRDVLVSNLSGGQKARLQLIRLLVGSPNLLILDEPTNHLDLPSIEELENAIKKYTGAVMYITHDSYFARNIGGNMLKIGA